MMQPPKIVRSVSVPSHSDIFLIALHSVCLTHYQSNECFVTTVYINQTQHVTVALQ